MSRFSGKVAVITGGNSGIGLATAKELAANGAKVVIAGRDQKTLDEAVQSIGNEAFSVQADVSKLGDIENLFDKASGKFGKIDVPVRQRRNRQIRAARTIGRSVV